MATNLSKVVKHLHHLLSPPGGDRTDGELLTRFVATRDEASFAALMRRHGPMVLSVCRRLLGHVQDAEDCFQATFMVLARKAATVKRESVGSWLYAVAYRTSMEARAVNARRRMREKQVQDMPHPEIMPPESQDWRPWLDQELNRMPEKYRAAIVACDLEGRSRKEAARLLGLTEGTLSSRLARGRRLLAKRLAPYGLSLSGAALALAVCESVAAAPVPAALLTSTTKAALLVAAGEFAAVSAASAVLMKGVLKSMFLTKLKLMVGAVMVVTALGASGLVYRASGQSASPAERRSDGKPTNELDRLRHENELLKLNLEVVLEKVRAQEAELRKLKAQPAHAAFSPDGRNLSSSTLRIWDSTTGKEVPMAVKIAEAAKAVPIDVRIEQAHKAVPIDVRIEQAVKPVHTGEKVLSVEGALKVRKKEEMQRAIDALEKAIKGLREQLKDEEGQQKGKPQSLHRNQPQMGMQQQMSAQQQQQVDVHLRQLQQMLQIMQSQQQNKTDSGKKGS